MFTEESYKLISILISEALKFKFLENIKAVEIALTAGLVIIKPAGTTINNTDSFTKTAGQYTVVTILMYAADTFITQGKMQK